MLPFDSERWDTDELHSTTVNTTRLTAATSGKYFIHGHVLWEVATTGLRHIYILLNGRTNIGAASLEPSSSLFSAHYQSIATYYFLNAGDYVELGVYQTSGGSLSINSGLGDPCCADFGMVLLRE